MHTKQGAIARKRTGEPRQHHGRELGDWICQACPRWDRARGEPTPPLGDLEAEVMSLAELAFGCGIWPHAGGVLDQDPEWLGLLLAARQSAWGRATFDAPRRPVTTARAGRGGR